ncbi:hypothetical protein R70006_05069 [Paraburkholderia domus]|nr:hypothetical protein R70006_05069 [Paraburkholderia domus]
MVSKQLTLVWISLGVTAAGLLVFNDSIPGGRIGLLVIGGTTVVNAWTVFRARYRHPERLLPKAWHITGLAGHVAGIVTLAVAYPGRPPAITGHQYLCASVAMVCAQRLVLYAIHRLTRASAGALEYVTCFSAMTAVVVAGLMAMLPR